jgi:hypothetical protein
MCSEEMPNSGAAFITDAPRYYGFAESKKGLVKIEEGKPLTFFVLADEYSSKGIWVHPVGVHFINEKQITCSEEEEVLSLLYLRTDSRDESRGERRLPLA